MEFSYPSEIVQRFADGLEMKGSIKPLMDAIPSQEGEVKARAAMTAMAINFIKGHLLVEDKDEILAASLFSVKEQLHFHLTLPLLVEMYTVMIKHKMSSKSFLQVLRGNFGKGKEWDELLEVIKSVDIEEEIILRDEWAIMSEMPLVAGSFYYLHGFPLQATDDPNNKTHSLVRVRCIVANGSDVDVKDELVVVHNSKMKSMQKLVPGISDYGPIRSKQVTFRCKTTNPYVAESWYLATDKMPAESFAIRTGGTVTRPSDGNFLGEMRHEVVDNGQWTAGASYYGGVATSPQSNNEHSQSEVFPYLEADGHMINLNGLDVRTHKDASIELFHTICAEIESVLQKMESSKDDVVDGVVFLRDILKVYVNALDLDTKNLLLDNFQRSGPASRWKNAWVIARTQKGAEGGVAMRIARVAGEMLIG